MKDYLEDEKYLEKVLRYLPKYMNAEIASTGGGYYSVVIPFDQYHLDISNDGGGLLLYNEHGEYVAILSQETNPRKLAKIATNIYLMNFNPNESEN